MILIQKSKIKNQKYKLKFKNFAFWIVILHFTFCILHFPAVYAATVTTQATVSTPSASPTDEKVEEIRDAVKQKVTEKIQEIKDKIEKKGYVGVLTEMTDSTLTLETLTGEKMVQVASPAAIIGTNKKEIKVKDLEIDQKLICMGTIDENKILVAKRIIVVAPPAKAPPKRLAFIGRLAEIDTKTKILTLNHLRKLSEKYLVKIDKNSKFLTGDFEDLKTDQVLVVVSSQQKESETPTALVISPRE